MRVVDRRWWARGTGEASSSESGEIGARKPTYVEELEQQIADKTAQIQTLVADHRRALDEFDQARARLRREVARDLERGKRAILAELLDVVDNLDRAVAAAREPSPEVPQALDQLARGVELVRDQFLAKLLGFGVSRIEALGEDFDAARHEAVTVAPIREAGDDGKVISVIREGYRIGDEILRPASVVVGKASQR